MRPAERWPSSAASGVSGAAAPARALRVLVVTTLFPNAARPGWAPFNRQQLAAFARLPGVEVVDVLATLPWFPAIDRLAPASSAAGLGGVPRHETIAGLSVRHPRVLYLPRIGHGVAAGLFAASLRREVERYRGRVDVVLAAWAHPDGCAAVALGERLGVPVVVKAHGSDVNVGATQRGPARVLRRMLPRASRVVTVSAALAEHVVALGVDRSRIDVVRNGVDGALFRPRARSAARRALGWDDGPIVLCPGRVERAKGVFDLLDAFACGAPPDARLVYVGDGAALADLGHAVASRGLDRRVLLVGAQPLERMPAYLAACDVVVVPSWAEGLPNTILEAQACGRPVVATDVGGVREALDRPELGIVVPARAPAALGSALRAALARPWDATRIAASARRTWCESAEELRASLARAVAPGGVGRAPGGARGAVGDRAAQRGTPRARRGGAPRGVQRLVRGAGLVVALALVALVTTEAALRLASAASPAVAQMLAPGTPPVIVDPELGHRPSSDAPGHDAWGFRNEAVPPRADVVVLGDSQTYGEGVPADAAWPRVLAHASGRSVYALAYGGFGPAHAWLLRERALSLEPRVLLVALYLGNDLYDAYALARRGGRAAALLPDGVAPDPALDARARAAYARTVGAEDGLRTRLVRSLHTVALARAVYHELVRRAFPPAREAQWRVARHRAARSAGEHQVLEAGDVRTVLTPRYRLVALDPDEPGVQAGMAVTLAALDGIRLAAEAHGARFGVVVVPTKESVFVPLPGAPAAYPADGALVADGAREAEPAARLRAAEDAAREALLAALAARGTPVLDLLPALRSAVAAGRNPYPENADGHPAPLGHAVVAATVDAWLAQLLPPEGA